MLGHDSISSRAAGHVDDETARQVCAVVVVPTFRRAAMLLRTLTSLAAQETRFSFAVLVVENDVDRGEGLAVVESMKADFPVSLHVIVEPRQGNVHAINAGFASAMRLYPDADHYLMIDDDETASPGWIEAMIVAALGSGAEIVGGPVIPTLDQPAPKGIAAHPVFWPISQSTGPIAMINGTGNCLIRRSYLASQAQPWFDERFNFLGGADYDFFDRARVGGVRFHWVAEAVVTETVPASRANAGWIVRRGLRIGAINRAIDRKRAKNGLGSALVTAKDLAIAAIAPLRTLRDLARSGEWLIAVHPAVIALGRLAAIVGVEPSPYRADRIT